MIRTLPKVLVFGFLALWYPAAADAQNHDHDRAGLGSEGRNPPGSGYFDGFLLPRDPQIAIEVRFISVVFDDRALGIDLKDAVQRYNRQAQATLVDLPVLGEFFGRRGSFPDPQGPPIGAAVVVGQTMVIDLRPPGDAPVADELEKAERAAKAAIEDWTDKMRTGEAPVDTSGTGIGKGIEGKPTELVVRTDRVDSVVKLTDRRVVVLGGPEGGATKDKVPVLSDIPFLGHLFKPSKVHKEKQSLMIIITPQIVVTDEE